ncbi:urease accessory protein UreD [Aliagarivorans taiwanensis]|uniref:urease accessory protein UreD n=1 Tax=Aliagarivorans taiwanensis TaxID=561966 RepID=UPI00040C2FF7|nr:urease accessory protein UreD [Aliagarivorans taiwanensis]
MDVIEQMEAQTETSLRSWPARLDLGFAQLVGKTRLLHNHSQGPLRVQRPFFPADDSACHCYLLHPPGGLVAGDHLRIGVDCAEASQVLLTTPSSGKVYRSNKLRQAQIQQQQFSLAEGSQLEWLPPETIVFDGAQGELHSRFDLAEDARLVAWEITCLGRQAGNHPLTEGSLKQSIEVWRGERPLLLEHTRIDAASSLNNPAALAGKTVYACMLATVDHLSDTEQQQIQQQLRDMIDDKALAMTLIRGLLVLRYLGDRADRAMDHFKASWQVLRPSVMGRPASPPRIWNT